MSMSNYLMSKLLADALRGYNFPLQHKRVEVLLEGDKTTYFACDPATAQVASRSLIEYLRLNCRPIAIKS